VRETTRIRRIRGVGLLVVVAGAGAVLGAQSDATSLPAGGSPIGLLRGDHRHPPRAHRGALGEADGAVPHGTTVFSRGVPGVDNLDPALLGALRRAATDAADEGVEFVVNSGWRSAAYEEQLRREAIAKYGSEAEAARWVATGTTSAHVSGDAVDLGPAGATAWLSAHGAAYGLCQVYGNEPWHYELRRQAIAHDCPAMFADASVRTR
jgi:D-alanyl-D-alanine carboxypeptidase